MALGGGGGVGFPESVGEEGGEEGPGEVGDEEEGGGGADLIGDDDGGEDGAVEEDDFAKGEGEFLPGEEDPTPEAVEDQLDGEEGEGEGFAFGGLGAPDLPERDAHQGVQDGPHGGEDPTGWGDGWLVDGLVPALQSLEGALAADECHEVAEGGAGKERDDVTLFLFGWGGDVIHDRDSTILT